MNPDRNAKHSVYQIGGIPVEFPHKAYGSQLAFMGRVISTLDRAQRQGHCHALLESPTGTGKTLSLLCSVLAWQKTFLSRYPLPPPPPPQVAAAAAAAPAKDGQPQPVPEGSDPLVDGGGFIPEPESSDDPSPKPAKKGAQHKHVPPTIYYASRTHTQISQVISEYRKTSYRVRMAVLASRRHYCTNKDVCISDNVNENCKKLLKDEELGCVEFKNANRVKDHPSIKRDGQYEVHDIEDLVKIGQSVKGCSYFGALSIAGEAELVFCPYSYVINPLIRKAMDIDLKGDILILDEAHNIEDMARDAGSVDIDEEVLHRLQHELGELCSGPMADVATYQPLHDMVQGIISWINQRTDDLEYHDFEHYSSRWTGGCALKELEESGISLQNFVILEGCAKKAIKDYSEAGTRRDCLSGISATTLEGLFCSLSYIFSGNGLHATDYQLVLQRHAKRDKNDMKSWAHLLNLWCLNPAVIFKEIADLSLSVILTSGTLSPMGSFASELGVLFEVCMEAPHVINVESQLFAAVLSRGPGNHRLNASYKTSDGYAFQDALGSSLEEICKAVPGGVLIFFPSYKLLEKLHARWCQTGQWSRLNAVKPFFVEPRGSVDDFESVLKAYYNSISGKEKIVNGKTKRSNKRDLKRFHGEYAKDSTDMRGAALLAVCRGKISEGVNFSDDNARAVVIVGIPFPNIHDLQVGLKKKYNDTNKSSKSLLSGSAWYCHQAFRALNQAAGRCIRHRFDYGAIIFLDERLKEERNLAYIPKWIRQSIKQLDTFDTLIDELRPFFLNAKEWKSMDATAIESQSFHEDGDNMSSARQNRMNDAVSKRNHRPRKLLSQNGREKNQKQTKLHSQKEKEKDSNNPAVIVEGAHTGKCTTTIIVDDDILPLVNIQAASRSNALIETKQSSDEKEYIDLECPMQTPVRWPKTLALSCGHPNFGMVLEDSIIHDISSMATMVHKHSNRASFTFNSASNSNDILLEDACTVACSQEKLQADIHNSEVEASLSVNSHYQKRKKMADFQLSGCTQAYSFDYPQEESCCIFYDENTKTTSSGTNGDIKVSEEECLKNKHLEPFSIFCDLKNVKQLHACCLACRCSLGLHKCHFLIPCLLVLSSKICLSFVLKNGPRSIHPAQSLSGTEQMKIPVAITDVSNVDQRVLNWHVLKGCPRPDVWSEQDGCVFRAICCPFCVISDNCLGLQIMATDASNTHLLNKVFLFVDRLYFKDDVTSRKEDTSPVYIPVHGNGSDLMQIEQCAYVEQSKNSVVTTKVKSKLRLPKGDPVI